jgi:hypothetical protein
LLLSGLIGFVIGTATGAAGKYFADKYTDQRKEKESEAKLRRRFGELKSLMPELFEELTANLSSANGALVREFIVLPNERVNFGHSKPRFTYYESKIPDLLSKIALLSDSGFITDVTIRDTPIYRINDSFVRLLLKQ